MSYTNGLDDPSAYFQTATYTGAGANQTVTNDGNSDLQPDFLWIKRRNAGYAHALFDSNRGLGSSNPPMLESDSTAAENSNQNWISGVGTDSFTIGINEQNLSNTSGTYVAWQWKANGGTTASNSDGSVTSTVQANTDAGFSIVTFDSASSGNFSVGHGLGVQPAMIITKNREGTGQWYCWHKSLTGGDSNSTYLISLNRTDEEASYANAWGAGVTSSVFGMQSGNTATASNDYVAYCFAEKQGYSRFSSYVGNGNVNGPFIYTGFKPALVLVKRSIVAGSTAYGNWLMYDNKRGAFNLNDEYVYANTASAEATSSTSGYDFLSNGFKVRNTYNDGNVSGNTYIYMAFAENPFVTSTGIPTTAR